jgi:hypothetical protein
VSVQPLWQTLHEGGGDLVLVGHEHNYERFARLSKGNSGSTTPVADPNGMRQITVGTGGRNRTSFATVQPYSEVRDSSAFGVLKVTLHPNSYAWQFKPAAGYTFTDSGSTPCRS